MAHVAKMLGEVVETVVTIHQFVREMVPHIFQECNKCRLHNGIGTTFHKQVRDRVFQMKIIWISLFVNV